jgi:uncharacterized protein YdeI (YjbR/CyaY-like superfamily)
MPKTDKRVDAYIAKAPDYAKPILTRLREIAHEGAPDCEETLKWSAPAFTQNGILFIMAAFKEYCSVNFWKGALVLGAALQEDGAAGNVGKIYKVSDLPPKKVFLGYVKKAVELNETGTQVPKRPPKPKAELATPDYFVAALKKNKKAQAAFEAFSPSAKREYVEWMVDAKSDATRDRRLEQAMEWISEGKTRHWKYK